MVGASYDPKAASAKMIKGLTWTNLHIATFHNRLEAKNTGAKPMFMVRDAINTGLSTERWLKVLAQARFQESEIPRDRKNNTRKGIGFAAEYFDIEYDMPRDRPSLHVLFKRPLVFEVKGIGFQRPADSKYLMLRFPSFACIRGGFPTNTNINEVISTSLPQKRAREGMWIPVDSDVAEVRK